MVVLNGREFRTEPNSTRIITTPVGITLQANTRQVVDFANRFGGPATSLIIDNTDGAQAVTYNVNGQLWEQQCKIYDSQEKLVELIHYLQKLQLEIM